MIVFVLIEHNSRFLRLFFFLKTDEFARCINILLNRFDNGTII